MLESFIEKIRRLTEPEYFKFWLIPRARIRQFWCVRRIREKGTARIVFLVCSLPMWRSQSLYDRLKKDSRFSVSIAIYPTYRLTPKAQIENEMMVLGEYFSKKGVPFLDLSNEPLPGKALREIINPDIIFYPQPYNHFYWNDLDNQYFGDKLICYIPYGTLVSQVPWLDKGLLNNTAWRLFYLSASRKQQVLSILYNQGKNIRITGDPFSDLFRESTLTNVWKDQKRRKKRVIWAPHHSIKDGDLFHHNSFVWLNETMLKLAETYKDRIQFSFKPHPRLFLVLCELPGWGRKRAEEYYQTWKEGENTQLDLGPYLDLFKESDALIHDCASFTAEYFFVKKPALYTTKDINFIINQSNSLGKIALAAHYHCDSEEGIVDFIENTILGEYDPLKSDREEFFQKHLLSPNGQSAAENIYNEILSGLGFNR